MVRPCCRRRIGMRPMKNCFMPAQVSVRPERCMILTLDELEALRLADLMGLYHEEAAVEMGISRATFGRIVDGARRKIADTLVNGKVLLIEGGNTEFKGEHKMPQRDGTGPVDGGKGRGLGPCGCGQRRGRRHGRTAGQFQHRGLKEVKPDDLSVQQLNQDKIVDDDEKEPER